MNTPRIAAFVAIMTLAIGCSTTGASHRARVEFDDIPMPTNLSYLEDQAVIIESPGVKAARLVYRGRVSMATLVPAMRSTLESNGWKAVNSTTAGPGGTVQIYEKGRDSVQIRLWENILFTYVEVTTSRLAPGGANGTALSSWATAGPARPVTVGEVSSK